MRYRDSIVAILMFFMSTSPALADGWYASARFAKADQNGAEYFLSPNTEAKGKGVFAISWAERFLKPKPDGVGRIYYGGTLSCGAKSIKIDSVQKFGPNKDFMSVQTPKKLMLLIKTNTALEDFHRFVCEKNADAVTDSYFEP